MILFALLLPLPLALAPAGDDDDYSPLFNGKDLTGWSYDDVMLEGKDRTADGSFEVRRSVIVINEKPEGEEKDIRSTQTVLSFEQNFRFRLEFRAGENAESGITIRNRRIRLKEIGTKGWNTLEITVTGGHIIARFNHKSLKEEDRLELSYANGKAQAKLNGEAVDVADLNLRTISRARCLLNGEVLSENVRIPDSGPLGLVAEKGRFEFRDIRIQLLD